MCTLAGCNLEIDEPGKSGQGGSGKTVQVSVADLPPSDLGEGFCFVGEEGLTDVSVNLFRESFNAEENTMISPLSLITALTMTARGAGGDTLTQLETALDCDLDYFTAYLGSFLTSLEGREAKFTSANSVWIRDDEDRLSVEDQFIVDAQAYFDADIFKAAFDKGTVKDINRWCSEKTDGMIKELVQEIKPDEVIRLLNAICFDAKWQEPYESHDVREGEFLNAAGGSSTADFMHGRESVYLENDTVKGFIKPYKGGFSFAALVPKAGVLMVDGTADNPYGGETYGTYTGELTADALKDYVQSLTGEELRELLKSQQDTLVKTKIPVFTSEYSVDLIPALQALGVTDLFDEEAADLTSMATSTRGNIYISKVFQKTFIEVDADGTRAAAVTEIVAADCAAMEIPEYKEVYLDRPFLYMILDDATGVPVFVGTVMNMDE